ncbi:HAD family hydrolase [Schumannella soli]|uniref:HAD family phosphatase n=1 Tax=Schumannella soli TaxID=2590779 RepID=A0A506Y2L1_9MICO|nr:HAD family phosphatase [Schumannella soli]
MLVTDALPSAVLWDMDGTLVDTEPYWMTAESELVSAWGGSWTQEHALQMVGLGLPDAARILQSHGVGLSADEIVATMTARVIELTRAEVPFRPGARELLRGLKDAGIPSALVTMSYRDFADVVIEAIGADLFAATMTGDEVEHTKPHPAPYLRGAELLGVDVRTAIAIEDSRPGVASAVASGATVVAVPLHVELPESHEYTLWDGFDGRGLADLLAVHAERSNA